MATKRRLELKSLFKNGSIPTAQHFTDLIDSCLNKRDDHFFGLWQPGTAYYPGDVVIYGKSMYMLQAEAIKQPPPKVAEENCDPTVNVVEPYCKATPPPEDSKWCLLDFDLQDDDWTIDKSDKFMYATNLAHDVGIGTDCPTAKLHVEENEYGKLEFDPHDSPYYAQKLPELRITAFDLPDCKPSEYLSLHLDPDFAHAETNTKNGFSFEQLKPGSTAQQKGSSTPTDENQLLMVVTSDGPKAEVGIGIKDPAAGLHVSTPNQGEWLVNPSTGRVAETRLAFNGEKSAHKLEGGFASFETNASQGFRFFVENASAPKDNPGLPVIIDENNHVGVGTFAPAAHLEVTRPDCGSIQSILDQINPAFAVMNLKPTGKNTYFTVGADNSFAVLKTDAPCGYVFKRGDVHGSPGYPERNINQGEGQVYIDQDGKVGIGVSPDGYELDDCGRIRSFEAYLAHDQGNIQNTSYLKENEGLDIVCRLHPIRFKWRENLGNIVSRENDQFGLPDFECADVVPEVVRTTGKDEKAIAYQNLVPVLIKAIQEQQKMIDELRKDLAKLK